MDVKECRRLRLLELLEGMSAAELSRRTGMDGETAISPATISRMRLSPLESKNYKGIGESNARRIENAAKKSQYWMDTHPLITGEVPVIHGQSQHLRPVSLTLPPSISWGSLMSSETLPPQFTVVMPDDALAGRVPSGTVLVFSTQVAPRPGVGVLVRSGDGRRYIRRYAEAAGGAWQAQATNDAYVTLDSERDGLQLLAVMTGKMTGDI